MAESALNEAWTDCHFFGGCLVCLLLGQSSGRASRRPRVRPQLLIRLFPERHVALVAPFPTPFLSSLLLPLNDR